VFLDDDAAIMIESIWTFPEVIKLPTGQCQIKKKINIQNLYSFCHTYGRVGGERSL
jgi:hypothetical protein